MGGVEHETDQSSDRCPKCAHTHKREEEEMKEEERRNRREKIEEKYGHILSPYVL
jgi:hypothetical protein